MNWLRWLEEAYHYGLIIFSVAMVGLAFGVAYGWLAGSGVVVATVAVLMGLNRAVSALARKSLKTKIPQRRFPGPRK